MDFGVVERRSDLLGLGPEVVDGAVLVGQNVSSGDEDVVNTNALSTVRHPKGVVEDGAGVVVGESVKIPVRVAAQHDGGPFGSGGGVHLEIPVHAVNSIGDVGNHLAGEAFFTIGVLEAKGDGILGVRDDSEVAPVPAIRATVKGVDTVGVGGSGILVGLDMEGVAINGKGAVLDAVCIAPRDTTKVRVKLVFRVVRRVVIACDNITNNAILVLDHDIGDGRAVRNEGKAQVIATNPVLSVLVRPVGVGFSVGSPGECDCSCESSNIGRELHCES